MNEDEAFLRAILDEPADTTTQLVYADWLAERGDPRAEYMRLEAQLQSASPGDANTPAIRRRMVELRAGLPPAWLAALGDHRRTSTDDRNGGEIERAAGLIGRAPRDVDYKGYEREIVAGAVHPLTGAVATVECRSQEQGSFLDISFHLWVRDLTGRAGAWEIETYNPYFGCNVGFLGWYGAAALAIYREKHRTYVYRFGFGCRADFKAIEDDWVLDGNQLGYRGYRETGVRRLTVPGLEELPPISEAEAGNWRLLPKGWE